MRNYNKIQFEDIAVFIDQLKIDVYDSIVQEVFPAKSSKIAIWHSTLIHCYDDTEKDIVGSIDFIFSNNYDYSRKAIFFDVHLRARGKSESEADHFFKMVKFAYSYVLDYVNENEIIDEKGNQFKMPEFLLTAAYFKYAFPN